MHVPKLKQIEQFFNMSFIDIINRLHWEKGYSIKSLSDKCCVSRDTFMRHSKRLGLKLRNIKEATKLTNNKGKNHWACGLRKENSNWANAHSERMKKNNPMALNDNCRKVALTKSKTYKRKLYPQEVLFEKYLIKYCLLRYESQKPIDRYIIDFFISSLNLCIEIDSTAKWGKERRLKADLKDHFLKSKGYKILRIDKRLLDCELIIYDILKTNNIIF